MTRPRLIPILLLIIAVSTGCSKKEENKISIGSIDSLHSDILNEHRKIWVSLPYDQPDPNTKYPVLYLLDGDAHFHSVTGLLQQLTGNGIVPPMIVVAIPNTDRTRDLTPTHSLILPGQDGDQDFLQSSGGAENFTQFIEKELIPYIEKKYSTAPHRVLVGHSFGGLFAINTLIHHPDIFDSYLAIDPSMWWDGRKLLQQSDSVLRTNKYAGKTLFISVANTMQPGMDTLRVTVDTTGSSEHIRSIIAFSKLARSTQKANDLNFGWKYYNEDDHGSVPLISEYDALRFMFSFYRLPVNVPYLTVDTLVDHYKTASTKLGYTMLPPEGTVNEIGYYFLRDKNFDKAFRFFDLNIKNYPNSQNVYDSMGDYYAAMDDKPKAIEYFKRALEIGEVEATRKKLEELEKEEKDKVVN